MEYVKFKENLKKVASTNFDAMQINLSLIKMLGYRQAVAQQLLEASGEKYDELKELFNYTNNQIKELLAIVD